MTYFGAGPPQKKLAPIKPKPGGRNGGKGRNAKEQDQMQSKQDLLAALTRQAEENTKILERERITLGVEPANQKHGHQQPHGLGGGGLPPAGPSAGNQRKGRSHVFGEQGKKVFDPANIPGLGGGGGNPGLAPTDSFNVPGPSGPSFYGGAFNGTFPETPSFFPGMVFNLPGGGNTGQGPPTQQQQQQQQQQGFPMGGHMQQQQQQQGPPTMQGGPMQPPRGPATQAWGPPSQQQQQQGGPNRYPQDPYAYGRGGGPPPGPQMGGLGPPGFVPGPPMAWGPPGQFGGAPSPLGPGGGGFGHNGQEMNPKQLAKMEAEARKEAYRRDLEEQIRLKKQAKEAEEAKRRAEDAAWQGRAAPDNPWDMAARRGGGGEPVRDMNGRPMADLRGRMGPPGYGMQDDGPGPGPFGSQGPIGMMGPPPMAYPQGPPIPGRPPMGGPPPMDLGPMQPNRLTVAVPPGPMEQPGGGRQAPWEMGPPGGMQGPGGPMMGGGMQGGMQGGGGSPGAQMGLGGGGPGNMGSPNSIPPVSPGNRRFMAAMSDLLAGPTDDQRQRADDARRKLQMDLEAQIREKKERQARERAEEERERQKEEAELKAYYDRMNEAKDAERRAHGLPPQQQQMQAPQPPVMPPPEDMPPRRRRGGGHIIDASWLDAPKPAPPQGGNPLDMPAGSPGAGMFGMSPEPQPPGRQSQYGRVSEAGGGAGGGGPPGVTGLLHQLQEEQVRMREEFARQAAAMEKLAEDAGRALQDRDQAWQEVQQVKEMLGVASPGARSPGAHGNGAFPHNGGPSSPTAAAAAAIAGLPADLRAALETPAGPMVVHTHLVDKSVGAIPDELPQPIVSEVLERGYHEPDPPSLDTLLFNRMHEYDGSEGFPLEAMEAIDRVLRHYDYGYGPYGNGVGHGRSPYSNIPLPPGLGPPGGGGGGRGKPPLPKGRRPPLPALPSGGGRGGAMSGLDMPAARKPLPPHYPAPIADLSLDPIDFGHYSSLFNDDDPIAPPPLRPLHNGFTSNDGGSHWSLSGAGFGGGAPTGLPPKPSSPAILRGDHLPSPVKGTRSGGPGAGTATNKAAGRNGARDSALPGDSRRNADQALAAGRAAGGGRHSKPGDKPIRSANAGGGGSGGPSGRVSGMSGLGGLSGDISPRGAVSADDIGALVHDQRMSGAGAGPKAHLPPPLPRRASASGTIEALHRLAEKRHSVADSPAPAPSSAGGTSAGGRSTGSSPPALSYGRPMSGLVGPGHLPILRESSVLHESNIPSHLLDESNIPEVEEEAYEDDFEQESPSISPTRTPPASQQPAAASPPVRLSGAGHMPAVGGSSAGSRAGSRAAATGLSAGSAYADAPLLAGIGAGGINSRAGSRGAAPLGGGSADGEPLVAASVGGSRASSRAAPAGMSYDAPLAAPGSVAASRASSRAAPLEAPSLGEPHAAGSIGNSRASSRAAPAGMSYDAPLAAPGSVAASRASSRAAPLEAPSLGEPHAAGSVGNSRASSRAAPPSTLLDGPLMAGSVAGSRAGSRAGPLSHGLGDLPLIAGSAAGSRAGSRAGPGPGASADAAGSRAGSSASRVHAPYEPLVPHLPSIPGSRGPSRPDSGTSQAFSGFSGELPSLPGSARQSASGAEGDGLQAQQQQQQRALRAGQRLSSHLSGIGPAILESPAEEAAAAR